MNKKILISLSVIAAVAALVIGGTIAYFSDTETSTGNTFTAGELDLLVDIDGVVYNPLNGRKFFDENDLKPGDDGEVTISLEVENDACGFVEVDVTSDDDNSCTEPEDIDEDGVGCGLAGGELNDNIHWMIWLDQGVTPGFQGPQDLSECDNDYIEQFEPVLVSGTISDDVSYGFGKMDANVHYCYGVAWNFDPNTNNIAQTDSFTGDIILIAQQYRNQYDQIGCPRTLPD